MSSSATDHTAPAVETIRLRTHVHLLEAETVRLRALLAQAETQLAEGRLATARAALEPQVRSALGLPPEAPLNWQAVAQWCAQAGRVTPTASEGTVVMDRGA